jgi:hypothetical protein
MYTCIATIGKVIGGLCFPGVFFPNHHKKTNFVRGMVMSRIFGWKLMEDSNANDESLTMW